MLPDEVRKAVEYVDQIFDDTDNGEWAAIKAHLLAREAEVERLQAIEKERWDVVATRNAAVMRAERAEALLRETRTIVLELCNCYAHPCPQATIERITAHLADLPEITCCYCGNAGSRSQIHKGGWILAKSRIGGYACTECAPIDKAKDKQKDSAHD